MAALCNRIGHYIFALKIHDAKDRHLHTIAQLCRAISSQLRHISTIGKTR